MSGDRYFFHGECRGLASLKVLSIALASQDVITDVHRHSLRLKGFECASIEFDRGEESEAAIEGTAKLLHVAQREAKRLSEAFSSLNIQHWLEVADATQNQIEYIHNQWPEE